LLTDDEQERLRLEIFVRPGSTDTSASLTKIAKTLFEEALKRMSPAQAVASVLGVTLIITSGVVLCSYLDKRLEVRKSEILSQEKQELLATQRFLSEQETHRLKILQVAFGNAMIQRGVDVEELATRLNEMGIQISSGGLANKISRGGFSSAFLMQCMEAMDTNLIASPR